MAKRTNILGIIILIFILFTYESSAYAEIFELNQTKSKIIYSLSKFNIPFKIKALPASGHINLKEENSNSCSFLLEGLDLKVNFTSKLALFRRAIDYDKYPYFSFSTDIKEPILIKDNSSIDLYGNLTFHGVTKKIKISLKCSSKKDFVQLIGHFNIKMSDFGIIPPRILFITIDDLVKTKFELLTDLKVKG